MLVERDRARKAAYGGGSRKRNSSVSFHFGASVFARQVELRFCPPHLRVCGKERASST